MKTSRDSILPAGIRRETRGGPSAARASAARAGSGLVRSLVPLAALFLTGGAFSALAQETLSIAEARRDRDRDHVPDRIGQIVTVRGRASVGSGVLHPQRFGVYIEDDSAGIALFDFDLPLDVRAGDVLRATGTVGHHNGLTQIQLSSVVRESRGRAPEPFDLGGAADFEDFEGRLVRVRGRVGQVGTNSGGHQLQVQLDDGGVLTVFAYGLAGFSEELRRFGPGDRMRITGILGQWDRTGPFDGGYQIFPRNGHDLEAVGLTRRVALGLVWGGGVLLALVGSWSAALRRQVGIKTRELAESEGRYGRLMDQAPGAVLVHRAGELVYLNAAGRRLLGLHPEEALHERLDDVLSPASADRLCALDEGRTAPVLLTLRDGSQTEVEVDAAPVTFLGERAVQVWIQDVTERNARERARRKLEERVREAARLESLGHMAGGIAHDFNNLLVGILGNAGLAMRDLPRGSEVRMLLGEVEKSARRAAELTHQMLTFSGRGAVSFETLKLPALVQEMGTLLGSVVSKKASIETRFGCAGQIEGDRAQIRQLVLNLVTNASEALGAAEGRIAVKVVETVVDETEARRAQGTEDFEPGRYVTLIVSDDGQGMSEETMSRMFDPFYSTRFTGRGLGLASVLGVVKGHRGGIVVDSMQDVGTSIRVFFPPAAGGDRPSDETDREVVVARPAEGGSVLVVDDGPSVHEAARTALTGD